MDEGRRGEDAEILEVFEILEILEIKEILEILEVLGILEILEILEVLEILKILETSHQKTATSVGKHWRVAVRQALVGPVPSMNCDSPMLAVVRGAQQRVAACEDVARKVAGPRRRDRKPSSATNPLAAQERLGK